MLAPNISQIIIKLAAKTFSRSIFRFVIYRPGGNIAIASTQNFVSAEWFAILLADVLRSKMEVFDAEKEVSYFVEPRPRFFARFSSQINPLLPQYEKKNKSGKQKTPCASETEKQLAPKFNRFA